MCWYIEFSIEMMGKSNEAVNKVEELINGFKVKVGKRGLKKSQFVKGTIAVGFRTALHCDCDNVKIEKEKQKGGSGFQLLYYPDL